MKCNLMKANLVKRMGLMAGVLASAMLMGMSSVQAATADAAEKVKKETGEAVDATTEYAKETKEQFKARVERNLTDVEDSIKRLQDNAKTATDTARATLNKQIADLEKRRQSIKEDLKALDKSSSNAWTHVKAGISNALGDLKSAIKKASNEFKDEPAKPTARKGKDGKTSDEAQTE